MKKFAQLLELLALTPSRNRKLEAMMQYFASTPDPDRGYALAILTGALTFKNVKPAVLREVVTAEVDPHLFALSYDYVGDLGETIALIWPHHGAQQDLPSLTELIELFNTTSKSELSKLIASLLTRAAINERWALVKLATGALRIGVNARLAKTALAEMSGKELQQLEEIWHGLDMPYAELFAWLDGTAPRPDVDHASRFHPLMLSNPIDEAKDLAVLDPAEFSAEWKWDGIRVQLILGRGRASLFSRTGDDIATAFPDLVDNVFGEGVLDGELLVGRAFEAAPFNDLQQRLNRKVATPRLLDEFPAFVRVYDMLFDGSDDIRTLPWSERRRRLEAWFARHPQTRMDVSEILPFADWEQLAELRRRGAAEHGHEGVMLKLRSSPYVPGRPKGLWFKWKRDPNVVDAILMYAQRGHGKRSSFYSDYTFGVWAGNEIVPIGKAYFGFTDEELKHLDRWVRNNTVQAFGPVREVKKELVFEVAFDSAQRSSRHKSGVALRFPRISRIRWDKPAAEAATLADMQIFVEAT
ncbi:MAG: ATP-dependent DNA ligase [Devosia sp. 67-54]|uniref:cisplatin damage response ATP-dependent DNA ligase n=1 Tax=unclassified Devosia TaxID=196773 RepID=UPI00086E427E|nr:MULTISPECIES: cisplatin damage response ATP-dependent DNA ligase [unclassified Devosia]MBN9306023.1 cisplatin damage response ATP-dependent DNA ligase [Devosia sp.]ODU62851.1 MAG: ATP-dependent DNA ligase [Pelagibacterium sp. SCN 68-10]OJX16302.1 MAG: ATP-dependent DNA ligase [Devosia sp. 67-54]